MNTGLDFRRLRRWELALAAFALSARTTYVWNPNGSGGWQSSGQYVEAGGATPTAHDVVQIPENVTVEVATDADAAFVNARRADSGVFYVHLQPAIRHPVAVRRFRRGHDH